MKGMSESKKGTDGVKPKYGRGQNPNSRRNLLFVGKQPEEIKDEEPDGGPGTLYEDMQHVRRKKAIHDKTQGQRDCRAWKAKDIRGFMMKFADLEKAAEEQKAPEPSVVPTGVPEKKDEGSERVEELIERLLKEARG